MKRFPLAALFLAALAVTAWGGEKKSLLIMFDGLRADALYSTPTPNIDSIVDGSWAPGYHTSWTYQAHTNLDADPSSATNHVAIITGVTAEKNRCFNNGQTKDALWEEYPSYLSRLRAADPSLVTVWLYDWGENADIKTDATFFSEPPGDDFAGDMRNIDRTIAFLNGTFDEPADYHGQNWIKGTDPDAIGLYLSSLDLYGHRDCFSAFDPEYCRRMEMYDARVGDLLAAIKARPSFDREDWMIVIVADHGGYRTGHGIELCENCYTIPLIVTSKHTAAGRMLGQPQNCDCAAYLLDHHLGAIPAELDGKIEEVTTDPAPDPDRGKVLEMSFDRADDPDAENDPSSATERYIPGVEGEARYFPGSICLGDLPELATDRGLTFSFWFRTGHEQQGDPPLLSNKDWTTGRNPGIALVTRPGFLSLNIADGQGHRDDIGPLDYYGPGWWFAAITVLPGQNAVLYLGNQEGRLAFVSDSIAEMETLATNLPWYVGQDGTNNCECVVSSFYIDRLNGWNRALSTDEVKAVFLNQRK